MVDASNGESLADDDSLLEHRRRRARRQPADVFVDIGGLIEQSGGKIDPKTQQFLDSAGIDPDEATALASLIPGSDQVEIDVSSDARRRRSPPSGDASEPARLAAGELGRRLASADFGKRFEEAIDQHRRQRVSPARSRPHKLKSTLKEAGIDLEKITSSIGDLGVFAEGNSRSSLGGAVVLTTEGRERSEEHRLQHRPAAARQPAPPGSPRSAARRAASRSAAQLGEAAGRRRQGQPDRDRYGPSGAAARRNRRRPADARFKEAAGARRTRSRLRRRRRRLAWPPLPADEEACSKRSRT